MVISKYRKFLWQKELLIYLFPPALIISCYLAFHFFAIANGQREGYFLGMIFYWLIGCLIPAFLWIGRTNRKLLFRITRINWWQSILVIIPVMLAVIFGPFRERVHEVTFLIILLSLLLAFVNAFCEELLWRGLFYVHHQGNVFYAVIVPSIWFGIWHYAPLSVHPATMDNFFFILAAIGLGLCWGLLTYFTRSLLWSIISHMLVDFSGLGILYYFSK